MDHESRWVAVASVLGVVMAVALWAAEAGTPARLDGRWTLNRSLTQTPKREGGPSFHFGPGGRGGRRERPRPEGEEGAGPGGRGGAAGPVRLGGEQDLMIDGSGGTLRLVGGDGHVRLIYTDGRVVQEDTGRGPRSESASWRNGALVVTTTTPRATITETLALEADGSGRLVHTVRVERKGAETPLVFRWVYDRAERSK